MLQLLASTARLWSNRRKLATFQQPYAVHVACGNVRFEGWVNLDLLPQNGVADLVCDVRNGLPFADGSCQYIYNEHFLEHLSIEDGLRFLKECRRVLRVGGVLRVAMPNLSDCVQHYVDGSWRDQPWLNKYGYDHIATGAEYLNAVFREWEHRHLYDYVELERRLTESGFQSTVRTAFGESVHGPLRGRETRAESTLVVESQP